MYLPDVKKQKTSVKQENENLVQEKDRLRNENYYYRSHLKELEVHNKADLDLMQRLK